MQTARVVGYAWRIWIVHETWGMSNRCREIEQFISLLLSDLCLSWNRCPLLSTKEVIGGF